MGLIRLLILVLVLVFLVAQASSQGYAGTVTTGKGIIPPLKVGSDGAIEARTGSGNQVNLTGIWSLGLLGSSMKYIELNAQQSKDVLMGYGSITAEGNSRRVSASGNISGSNIDLSVLVINSSEMYRLKVSQSGTSLTGKYDTYSAGVITLSGTVTGSIKPSNALGGTTIILGNYLNQAAPVDVRNSAATQESIQGATSNGTDHRIERKSYSSTNDSGQITTSDVAITTNYS